MQIGNSRTSMLFGMGCAVLFALPFAGFGIGTLVWCAHIVLQQSALESWVEVPATIKATDIKAHHDGEGGVTQQTTATYEYEFNGRKFTSERISIYSGSDNVGRFQENAHRELKRHLQQHKPFRCFVDPQNPSQAVLYRNLRGEMLAFYTMFATTFGSVGLGIIAFTLLSARQQRWSKLAVIPTSQPWLVRDDWAAGEVQPKLGMRVAAPALAVLALYWNLATIPLLTKLSYLFRQPDIGGWKWASLAFPAIGALLAIVTACQFVRARKFGESMLKLASTPGVIGGQLAGVVQISQPFTPADGFHLELTCIEHRSIPESSYEHVLWQDERIGTAPMTDPAGGTAVPFLFAIPFECEETSKPSAQRTIEWRLVATARMPRISYKSSFELPVFKTSASRADFKLDQQLSANYAAKPNNDELLAEAGFFKEPQASGGIRLLFPAARNWKNAVGLTLFWAFWTGATVLMRHGNVPIIFPIVSGLFDLMITWIVLDLWLYRSVVEANSSELSFRGGLLGLGLSRSIAVSDIKQLKTTEYMSMGANIWESIVVVPHAGRKRKIAKGIRGKLLIEAVLDELNTAMGRSEK